MLLRFTGRSTVSCVTWLRAVHHVLRDVLVYRTVLYVLRLVCWIDRTTVLSLRAPRVKVCDLSAQLLWFASTSFLALANGSSMTSIVLRVLCFGVRVYVPPKLFEFCSHRCVWPCASWSVGTSRHRHARFLIDPSTCLVQPRTRDRRIKCVPHGPLTVSVFS